jgi:hypothetical protein
MGIVSLEGLSGCQFVVTGDADLITLVIMALRTCEEHQGTHHFGVVDDGRSVLVSMSALACLRKNGVNV